MGATGTGMIVKHGTLIRVSQIKRIGIQIDRTKQWDGSHTKELEAIGWKVIVIWECEVRQDKTWKIFYQCLMVIFIKVIDTFDTIFKLQRM